MKINKILMLSVILFAVVFLQAGELLGKIQRGKTFTSISQNAADETVGELYDDTIIKQTFIALEDNITSIDVLIEYKGEDSSAAINYGIIDMTTGKSIAADTIDALIIKDNSYNTFNFKNAVIEKGKEYAFYIETENIDIDSTLTIYKSGIDTYENGVLSINDDDISGDLAFRLNSTVAFPRTYAVAIAILLIIGCLVGFLILRNKSILEYKFFTLSGIIFGVIMMLLIPPLQAPDEPVHFYRAYEIARGGFITDKHENVAGAYLPESIRHMEGLVEVNRIAFHPEETVNYEGIKEALRVPLEKDKNTFYGFPSSAVYAPVQYIPQSTAIVIGELLNLPILATFYLARLFNLIAWVLIIGYAIKILPFGKKVFALISLTPMALQQAASLSSDALLNASAIFFIAYVFKCSRANTVLRWKDKVFLFIPLCSVVLSKFVYFPLGFLMFLIPVDSFKSRKRRFVFIGTGVFVSLIIAAAWTLFINNKLGLNFAPFEGVNTGEQIKFAITNPIYYLFVIRQTLQSFLGNFINELVGQLGWLDTQLPSSIIYSYFFVVIFTALISEIPRNTYFRMLSLFIFLVSVILVFSSLYAGWTPVGNTYVQGVQGRYFIPIFPLILMALPSIKTDISIETYKKGLYIYLNWALIYTALVVLERYYTS